MTDGNDWQKSQDLVLHRLERLEIGQEQTNQKIDALKSEFHQTPCPAVQLIEQKVSTEIQRVLNLEQSLRQGMTQFKWFMGMAIAVATLVIAASKFLFE